MDDIFKMTVKEKVKNDSKDKSSKELYEEIKENLGEWNNFVNVAKKSKVYDDKIRGYFVKVKIDVFLSKHDGIRTHELLGDIFKHKDSEELLDLYTESTVKNKCIMSNKKIYDIGGQKLIRAYNQKRDDVISKKEDEFEIER